MNYCGTSVLFVLKPPYTPQTREQFFTWLCERTSMETEACRQVALTGELTPILLSGSQTSNQPADWANQLEAMEVPIYFETIPSTDRPMEAVFVNGRIPSVSQAIEFCKKWNEEYPDNQLPRSTGIKLYRGGDVICLGTVEVRSTSRDRDPLERMIESYGLKVLAWVDIQNPWID